MTASSVPSINPRICLLALLASAGLSQTVADRVVYLGREPLSTKEKQELLVSLPPGENLIATPGATANLSSLLRLRLTPNPNFDPLLDKAYNALEPAKSLLIHNCTGFCQDPFFSFERILQKSAAARGMSDPSKAYAGWYAGAAKLQGFSEHVRPYPRNKPSKAFQLLAVVNRLDFAVPDNSGKEWGKAELRFVYGARKVSSGPDAEPFTVIVEFVLPFRPWKDFRTIAQAWADLSKSNAKALPGDLKTLLELPWSPVADSNPGGASAVRLRANFKIGQAGLPWTFAQWEFTKDGLVAVNLDDEMNGNCTGRQVLSFDFCNTPKPASCKAYLPMYDQYAMRPGPAQTVNAAELLVPRQCYFEKSPVMPGPANVCKTDPRVQPDGIVYRARNVFALQQCSGCHGAEGDPGFVHIANRPNGKKVAALSPFLTGGNPKATKEQLNSHLAGGVATVCLKVPWPGANECGGTVNVTRTFNDLARRGQYLAAVLAVSAAAPPPPDWAAVIVGFGPDMTH